MIRFEVDSREVTRALAREARNLAPALKDAVEVASAKGADHAAGNHVKLTYAMERHGVHIPRSKNPDGSHRFYTRTGNLELSIRPLRITERGGMIEGGWKAGAEYAAVIEFGSRDKRRRPFPYMRPAADYVADKIGGWIKNAFRGAGG